MTKVKDTSLEAYKKLKDSGRLNRQQQQVLEFFMLNHRGIEIIKNDKAPFEPTESFNYREVKAFSGVESAQKRLNELEKKGLIKKVGIRNGCSTYQYVPDPAEQKARAKFFTERKPEMERYTAWLNNQRIRPFGHDWFGRIGGGKDRIYTNAELVKAFKQSEKLSDQIIW